jgi:hypothetical protein
MLEPYKKKEGEKKVRKKHQMRKLELRYRELK